MTLEDFEKSLAEKQRSRDPREKSQKSHKDREERHHQSHHQHPAQEDGEEHRHRHKRRRHSSSEEDSVRRRRHKHSRDDEQPIKQKSRRHRNDDEKDALGEVKNSGEAGKIRKDSVVDDQVLPTLLKRDSWMEPPIGNEIEFVPRKKENLVEVTGENLRIQFEADLCQEELKHLIDNPAAEEVIESVSIEPVQEDVKYIFGDAGSEWRMRTLKNVFKQAEQSKKPLEEVALNQYGDLRAFDDAREEEIELDRRQTYGESYIGKEKPSGELFQERKRNPEIHKDSDMIDENLPELHVIKSEEKSVPQATILDQTALNRLKAKMMKAKLRGGQEAAKLEAEYDEAMSNAIMGENGNVVVLGKMQNRMLAGGRGTEVKAVDTKRGRERGLVEENEDMSIEDMIREERRNRGQQGGEGLILAERIAKDGKFTNDLEYMEENANKLAKRVQKSEINLKNSAIADFQKVNRILDNCPLCHHEDRDTPPIAPVISLATRVYLTIPTEPELAKYGACIVPIQHRSNLLECDDDEWEEIRNFMKSLTRLYHGRRQKPIFYENAARPGRHPHAAMMVVPMASSLQAQAPAFFRESILSSAYEWSQHKKLINTQAKAEEGMGRSAFKRSIAKEMPYFHAWFSLDGGLGHVVEDENTWPKGDLFAREVLAGMLRVGPEIWRKQGHWVRGDTRIDSFRKVWHEYDWTKQLIQES